MIAVISSEALHYAGLEPCSKLRALTSFNHCSPADLALLSPLSFKLSRTQHFLRTCAAWHMGLTTRSQTKRIPRMPSSALPELCLRFPSHSGCGENLCSEKVNAALLQLATPDVDKRYFLAAVRRIVSGFLSLQAASAPQMLDLALLKAWDCFVRCHVLCQNWVGAES